MRASSILPVAAAAGIVGGALWYLRRRDADATARTAAARADAAQVRADRAVAAAAEAQPRAEAARDQAERTAAAPPAPASIAPAAPAPGATVVATPRPSAPTAPAAPPRSDGARAHASLTRGFDDLFRRHGQGIPVAYLDWPSFRGGTVRGHALASFLRHAGKPLFVETASGSH